MIFFFFILRTAFPFLPPFIMLVVCGHFNAKLNKFIVSSDLSTNVAFTACDSAFKKLRVGSGTGGKKKSFFFLRLDQSRTTPPPPQPPQPLNLLRATHPHRGTHEGWVVGKLRGGGRGLGKWEPPWEFPCQRAHLTASLMEPGDVPQGPDGIQWSAR